MCGRGKGKSLELYAASILLCGMPGSAGCFCLVVKTDFRSTIPFLLCALHITENEFHS